VLQEHEIPLALLHGKVLLERGTQRVEQVAARVRLLGLGHETELLELGDQDLLLVALERLERLELFDDGLGGRLDAERLGHDVCPCRLLFIGQVFLGRVVEETDLDPAEDDRGKVAVSEGTSDDGLRLGNVIELSEGRRVSVGVALEVVCGGETVVWLGDGPADDISAITEGNSRYSHQVLALDNDLLSVLQVLGSVPEREQDTSCGPRELVTKRIVRVLRGHETTAEGLKLVDLASLLVHAVDDVDGGDVVDSGVEADLVEDDDPGLLALVLERLHGRGDVGRGDDVLLVPDRGLDHGGVEGVRDEGDDEVVLGDGGVECLGVGNVQLDSLGVGHLDGELLCGFQRSRGNSQTVSPSGNVFSRGLRDESTTEQEHLLSGADSGRGIQIRLVAPRTNAGGKVVQDLLAVLDHGPAEFGQDERGPVDVVVVVHAVGDGTERGRDGSLGVERAADEADLSGGV
jgi:hypothetical protein